MNATIRDMMNVLFPLRIKFLLVYIDMKRTTGQPTDNTTTATVQNNKSLI